MTAGKVGSNTFSVVVVGGSVATGSAAITQTVDSDWSFMDSTHMINSVGWSLNIPAMYKVKYTSGTDLHRP